MKEEIKSGQAEMKSTVNAFQEKMVVSIANRRNNRKETMFCQETAEARVECKEPTSGDMKAYQETTACHEETERDTEKTEPDPEMKTVAENQEVPKVEAAVESSGTMKKRHTSRHLAVGRRGEPEGLNRGYCGSRRKLAAACRKVSRSRAVARRKRNVFRKI
jgi:hypothetical protein